MQTLFRKAPVVKAGLSSRASPGPFCSSRRTACVPQAMAAVSTNGRTNGLTNGSVHAVEGSAQALEHRYLAQRAERVTKSFPGALGVDDFLSRAEIALFDLGFNGDNSIAMTNLCRDEVTAALKLKIEDIFGSSFNTNGLGGVLTCGVTGIKAGLSHSPLASEDGKERYVFFSFPHIAIDSEGNIGTISRPGRPGASSACGALKGALGEIHSNGIKANEAQAGTHETTDPEYSILKQRLARRLTQEGVTEDQAKNLDLVALTKVAERTITADLEGLIAKAVDSSSADYAVVTGIQIHNWGAEYNDEQPTLEWILPTTIYAVVSGQPKAINLLAQPGLTPRQIDLLAAGQAGRAALESHDVAICGVAGNKTTVRSVEIPHSHGSPLSIGTARKAEMYQSQLSKAK